jgi:uncharacterized membrane protein
MFSWALYGILHSLLASHACKNAVRNRFPDAFRVYRLTYNLLAVLLLIPPLWLLFSYPGDLLWRWPTALRWLADIAALSAVAGFIWSAKFYDTREFLGFSLHSAPIQHEYFELFHARYPARGTCVKQLSGTCNAVRNAT